MKTKLTELLKATRDLIVATPDFRYEAAVKGGACDYNEGGDLNFPGQVGCLLGQALKTCGEKVGKNSTKDSLTQLYGECGTPLMGFLQSVQDMQDKGKSWGDSWKCAVNESAPEARRIVKRHVPLKLPK